MINLSFRKLPELQEESRKTLLSNLEEKYQTQHSYFSEYQKILIKQKQAVELVQNDKIEPYKELEDSIIKKIINMQKVILPLENLYQKEFPKNKQDILAFRAFSNKIIQETLELNKKNQKLVFSEMSKIKEDISALKFNSKKTIVNTQKPQFLDTTV